MTCDICGQVISDQRAHLAEKHPLSVSYLDRLEASKVVPSKEDEYEENETDQRGA